MADPSGPSGPDPVLYPNAAVAGDLRTALQAAYDRVGVVLEVRHVPAPGWLRVGAEVRTGDRHANVGMAVDKRWFLLDCWMRGVRMAADDTGDLDALAAAAAMFLSGAAVRPLVTAWPLLRTWGFAEAFEDGEPAAIDFRWRQYLEPPPARARYMLELSPPLVAAAREPRLRALFPFTSHQDLGLRRSVTDGHGRALAWARPFGTRRYLVGGQDRRQLYSPGPTRTTLWGEAVVSGAREPADAAGAAANLLAVLDADPQPTAGPTP